MSDPEERWAQQDYKNEVRAHRSVLVRYFLIAVGTVSVALGIAGIFLPVLPTTPFLLLAAACYANSSERFYNWLMNHPWFGSYIRGWRVHRAIPLRAKIIAITLIIVTIGTSVVFFIPLWPVKIGVALIGIAVIVFLLRMKTLPADVKV